jgi:putative membrane protein
MAESLPKEYQSLLSNWRNSLVPHHSDSEVLSLFKHQVIVPIDKLAIKQVVKNVSAANVMIAVSPFAFWDMLIVCGEIFG